MNMMNMNWREAIKQAQQKIDKVLDIRPEIEESGEVGSSTETTDGKDSSLAQNDTSPSSISPRSDEEQIVVCEPVLPPTSHGHLVGDDIQTIVSSDIEILPESTNTSPEIVDDIELPDFTEMLKTNTILKEKLESEQRKHLELKEQNAKLCAKSSSIEKNFESFKSEASKFSQEAFKARQDAKQSRAKIAELTKELESMEEKLAARDTKIKGMKSAMEDNLAIVKKYTNSNNAQAESIKKYTDEIAEKTNRIQELEEIVKSLENRKEVEKTGTAYMDDMLEETFNGLRTEIDEYKKQNANLTENYRSLEQEMEARKWEYEQKLTEAVNAAQINFAQDISSLKTDYETVLLEKQDLEMKFANMSRYVGKLMNGVKTTRREMDSIRSAVLHLSDFIRSENLRLDIQIQKSFETASMKMKEEVETSRTKLSELSENKTLETKSAQTELDMENFLNQCSTSNTNYENCNDTSLVSTIPSNVSELLRTINELSFERDQLETTKRTIDLELKDTKRQLSEVLIMHGEKIEELEELKIDNEDLRSMLREQALSLTKDES